MRSYDYLNYSKAQIHSHEFPNDNISLIMSEQIQSTPKRPEFVKGIRVRMPEDYDFDTKGKDWKQYSKDFSLRTDAVWQKQQLHDWFRLTKKCFYFNRETIKYEFVEPEEVYTLIYEPWGFQEEEVMTWDGYSRTGCTTSFQTGLGPKQRVESSFNSFYSMPDYYIMCAMRFEKWWRCDMVFGDRRTDYDRNPKSAFKNMKESDHYPCFREYYETSYACADNILKFLVELSYAKKAADFWEGDVSNNEIRSYPTTFDSSTAPERVQYTY